MTVQELNDVFGNNVRRYRKAKGLTQSESELEKKLGAGKAVSNWEKGRMFPRGVYLVLLAQLLGVEVWQLFYTDANAVAKTV